MALLARHLLVGEERGRWSARPDGTPVLVTLHPAAILREPAATRIAAEAAWWRDLSLVRDHRL